MRPPSHHYINRDKTPGRRWLVIIFAALCIVNLALVLTTPRLKGEAPLAVSAFNTILWCGVLLGAVWFGKNWARYILIILLILGIFAYIIYLPLMLEMASLNPLGVTLFILAGLVNVASAWILGFSRSIKSLVRR